MLSSTIILPAEVTNTDPDNRTIDVKWYGLPGTVQKVNIVSDTGDFSLPKVGDVGLVIQHNLHAFYLGKIEAQYKRKIDGKDRDPDTNSKILAKRVLDGEIYIGNLIKRAWLSISSGGDFGLLSGFNDGLRYYMKDRILRLAGMTTRLIGNGVTLKIGSVVRDSPPKTDVICQEVPLVPSIEACIELLFQQVKIARFQLGHIKSYVSPTGIGADEFSTLGGRLRAILEVTAGPVTLASLKMDETGNIELTSLAGNIFIDTAMVQGIALGGLSAVWRALLGEPFLLHYKAHTHSTAMGPSGPMIVPVVDETVLSQKVKLI
jgi:hypothetical protein